MRVTRWTICMCALVWFVSGFSESAFSESAFSGAAEHHGRGSSESGASDQAEAVIAGDYFAAGATAEPESSIQGDAFITGGEVNLRSPVEGDAVLSGGSIYVGDRVGSDLYAAGGNVVVDAVVGHNARLAGGRVRVTPHADIAGKMTIAGSSVRMEGRVGGALAVFGDSVVIDGEVNGGAAVFARELKVGPNARIDGRLTYRTAQTPQISPQAIITGGTHQSDLAFPSKRLEPIAKTAIWVGLTMFTSGLFLVGLLIVVLAPHGSASVVRQLQSRPLATFLLGFALIIFIPVAASLAMVTVIGIPLGFVLLFIWPVVATLGYLFGVIFLGDALASLASRSGGHGPGRGIRVLGLAVVLVALLVLSLLVPIAALVILLLLFSGTGALVIAIRNAVR